jgi:hypothetical protein
MENRCQSIIGRFNCHYPAPGELHTHSWIYSEKYILVNNYLIGLMGRYFERIQVINYVSSVCRVSVCILSIWFISPGS